MLNTDNTMLGMGTIVFFFYSVSFPNSNLNPFAQD